MIKINNMEMLNALLNVLDNYLDKDGLLYFKQKIDAKYASKAELGNKVDKESGKGLSTNDYTTEEKQKLAGLKNYTLPTASNEILGGVKVGAGLSIDGSGILSATGGGEADSVQWDNVIGKPTKLSQFTNDSKFQTDTQVQQAINSAVSGITGIDFQVVESLPQTGKKGTIYLKSNTGSGQNIYDEYIWVNNKYEMIGTTQVDLSNYYNTTNFTPISNSDIDGMFQ